MPVQPRIKPEELYVGCICSSGYVHHPIVKSDDADVASRPFDAPTDMIIAAGFGDAYVTKDGVKVYDGEADFHNDLMPKTVGDIEEMAKADPEHDWRIVIYTPLHGETYQRHAPGTWVCIESNMGFA